MTKDKWLSTQRPHIKHLQHPAQVAQIFYVVAETSCLIICTPLQPAIYVSSLAAVEKLRTTKEGRAAIEAADVAAGLSLGEYTALAFAGAIR